MTGWGEQRREVVRTLGEKKNTFKNIEKDNLGKKS